MKTQHHNDITDAELLERYRKDGNLQWMGLLLERYTALLLGVCMKYLKNAEDARDTVQQIYLKVLTDAHKYKIDYFKSWLYMVAKNECLMRLRSTQGKVAKELTESLINVPQDGAAGDWLSEETTLQMLEEAIASLSAEQRTCVSLFYLQQKSYQQISEQTGFSLLQVKSYIQNGKRNLRLMLERRLRKDKTA